MRTIMLALLLGGCATTTQGIGCPRLTNWTAQDQKGLAAEYATAGPLSKRAIDDLKYMRDQTRACRGETP